MLLFSYLVKDRFRLHVIALISCFMKLAYCIDYKVWPLLANWVILIPVHVYAITKLGWLDKKRKEKE